jgi:DNA-binding transcriptional LysR family regulator
MTGMGVVDKDPLQFITFPSQTDRTGLQVRSASANTAPTARTRSSHFVRSSASARGGAGCRVVVDDGLSLKIATISGAGISMNSLWSAHREIAGGSLVRVLPDYQIDDQAALWLVYPKSNVLTAKMRVFIDFLLDRIGKSPPWIDP